MPNQMLVEVVRAHPYPDYTDWWPMGQIFLRFMSAAIAGQWRNLHQNLQPLDVVDNHVTAYLATVYGRQPRAALVEDFAAGQNLASIHSGEFDALSYGFFRAAFEWVEAHVGTTDPSPVQEKRAFAERVGADFYRQLHDQLALDLPPGLSNPHDFIQLKDALHTVGDFLVEQGYLRDHFAFRFDVETARGSQRISQSATEVLDLLREHGIVYALYEMGYPAILPSAVYLYQTMGEAQHHSSRTIQELFDRIGYTAAETADFDPTGYPSDRVVELWEIRPRR